MGKCKRRVEWRRRRDRKSKTKRLNVSGKKKVKKAGKKRNQGTGNKMYDAKEGYGKINNEKGKAQSEKVQRMLKGNGKGG